jgi:hypothetical protein
MSNHPKRRRRLTTDSFREHYERMNNGTIECNDCVRAFLERGFISKGAYNDPCERCGGAEFSVITIGEGRSHIAVMCVGCRHIRTFDTLEKPGIRQGRHR